MNPSFAIFCLVLGAFVLPGVLAAKKMPTAEALFSAAYLDSPVFNLDDGSLWVSDVQNDRVLRLLDVSPKTDAAKRLAGTKSISKEKKELADLVMSPPAPIRSPSGRARGIAFDQRGRLVMCESGGRRVTRLEIDGRLTVLAEKIDNKRLNSPDDLVIDSKGRIYFTDPRFGARDDMDMATEGVYRIDVDEYQGKHRVTRIMDNKYVKRPAGIVLSPDETKVYLVEAHPASPRLVVFELKRDGTIVDAPPYIVHDFDKGKGGDGLCIDSHGNLYVAGGSNSQLPNPAGIYAFSPEGTHLGFMPIPEDEVVSCRFGGWDMRTLYVTAGGGIYQARMPIPGFNTNFYPREDEEREVHVWEDEPPPPSPTPAATPCPVDERVSENGMLRERIAELEQELAAQEQWIRERELKLRELAEGSSALPRRRRRRRLVRRRPDDYDYYEYDDYDYPDYPDYDDYDYDYNDRRRGGRRRYADEEWEEWEEVYDEREVVPEPSRGLSASLSENGVPRNNDVNGGALGNGLRRPPQPVKRRAAIRQVKGDDPEQGGRGGATDRRSDVRHIFERGYDEL